MIEVHVTFSKNSFGPDVSSSVDFSQLKEIRKGVDFIFKMNNAPMNKDNYANKNKTLRNLFTKSLVFNQNLDTGTVLTKEHIGYKKPGIGLTKNEVKKFIGKIITRNVKKDDLLSLKDIGR